MEKFEMDVQVKNSYASRRFFKLHFIILTLRIFQFADKKCLKPNGKYVKNKIPFSCSNIVVVILFLKSLPIFESSSYLVSPRLLYLRANIFKLKLKKIFLKIRTQHFIRKLFYFQIKVITAFFLL